jgi:hypothetical protein
MTRGGKKTANHQSMATQIILDPKAVEIQTALW